MVFYSLGDGPDGGLYYDDHPIDQMRNPFTMLAYDMNGEPLSYGHGAPMRLRNELHLGFKQVKWIAGIEFASPKSAGAMADTTRTTSSSDIASRSNHGGELG